MTMASHDQQSLAYGYTQQDPLTQDYSQPFANLDTAHPSLCAGQGPFLQQAPGFETSPQEENHHVVVASNDLPVSDMDLVNILDMDDKALTGEAFKSCNKLQYHNFFLFFLFF